MKPHHDLLTEFPGLIILHQKIPASQVGRHQHEEHEFFLPLQGEISITAEGKTIKAGPGKMLYVPPDFDHSFSSSAQGSGERLIWLISKKAWNQHSSENFSTCAFSANSLAKELLFYLLINKKAEGFRFFTAALIETLKESLNSAQIQKQKIHLEHLQGKVLDPRIQEALQIIENDLGALSFTEVAKKSGLSSRNFSRLFLKETGITPKDYLILARIEKAKTLLQDSRLTITDIALEVGYNSLSKFIGTFKRIEGILPSDFRRRAGK